MSDLCATHRGTTIPKRQADEEVEAGRVVGRCEIWARMAGAETRPTRCQERLERVREREIVCVCACVCGGRSVL
jgi:hypothetical protein